MLAAIPGANPKVNPKSACDRTKELVEGDEWAHPIKLADAKDAYNSIIKGKRVACHPRTWDFEDEVTLDLWGATPDNKGTDAVYSGFLYPLEDIARDAVGPGGLCIGDPEATRDNPRVEFDWPFITGNSVESSIAFGKKIVEVLKSL